MRGGTLFSGMRWIGRRIALVDETISRNGATTAGAAEGTA